MLKIYEESVTNKIKISLRPVIVPQSVS